MRTRYFYVVILLFIGLCHSVSQAMPCTEPGKFPNDENRDCRGFVLCLVGGLTNFTQYKISCPQGSIYSHLEQQCTNATDYKCYPNFNCTSVKNYSNPENGSCNSTSYISCIMGMSEMDTARLIECPLNTTFDSTLEMCVDPKSLNTCNVTVNSTAKPLMDNSTQINIHNQTRPNSNTTNYAVSKNVNYIMIILINLVVFM